MLKFDPPEFESSLRAAIDRVGSSIDVEIDGYSFDAGVEQEAAEDRTIDSSSIVLLEFPRVDDGVLLTAGEFIQLSKDVTDPKTTCDGLIYHSQERTIIRMNSWDVRSLAFAERTGEADGRIAVVAIQLDGKPAHVYLRPVSPHFASAVVLLDLHYDKYNPPLTGDELFIEVEHTGGSSVSDASAVIQAYLFELHSTLGVEFFEWPRRLEEDLDYPEDEEIGDLVVRAASLRPLLLGQGLLPVLSEFNAGHGGIKGETSLLAYVKCIEYVSATVVREKQYEDLRKRLLSKDALSPNAEFMDGLLVLFEENRNFSRDMEALRLSVERCCDPTAMAAHAPAFLRNLCRIEAKSSHDQRKAALGELALALSATRNQMAHAKANYRATGKECPPGQLASLVTCARIAAEQCIRWYASRSTELRRG